VVHQLITIGELTDPNDTVWSTYDRKLEAALDAVEVAVSIRLRNEMGHGVELVRWLEGWTLRFRQQQKTLISIAEDPAQRQCIELSHPDMALTYISSINEIPKMLLRLTRRHDGEPAEAPDDIRRENPVRPAAAPGGRGEPSIKPVAMPPEKLHAPAAVRTNDPARQGESMGLPAAASPIASARIATPEQAGKNRPDIGTESTPETGLAGYGRTLSSGSTVVEHSLIEISGEYRCDNCGMVRMFCKGDIVDRCENRECFATRTSFTLQFDLF
jgi:hypothetical protein